MERDETHTATTGAKQQPTITWTMFRTPAAMSMEVKTHTLNDLAQFLADAGPYQNKASCPWIKLATFGNLRSKGNSLRHNANVVAISGVEGDYDEGQVTPEQAIEMLERAGVRAIVYTSPSHRPSKPRWRVIAPCLNQHAPLARTALLARINGVLGGILAPESFTLSQSYFFGEVQETVYKVFVTYNDPEDGFCVDELDELDNIAITKEARRHANDEEEGSDYSVNMFYMAVVAKGRKLKTGDGRRELLKQYIASRSARGLLRDELLAMVESVVNKYFDPADPPDPQNLLELVDHFSSKDTPMQPVDMSGFTLSAMGGQETDDGMEFASPPPPAAPLARKSERLSDYPTPFPGMMSRLCEAASAAAFKPQPRLNMLGALIGISASINAEYSTKSGGRLNLYGLGVLHSGGGKDMPRRLAEIVATCAKSSVLGRPGSGAGIEDVLQDRKSFLISVDEVATMMASSNDERAPAHLREISDMILRMYSVSSNAYNRRVLSAGSLAGRLASTVYHPCMNMLGFSTPEGLGGAFSEKNLSDGLLGRMLFVQGEAGVIARRPETGFVVPKEIYDWAAQIKPTDPLASVAGLASVGSVVVGEAHGIREMLDKLLVEMGHSRPDSSALASSLYARSYEKLERIACVLAVMEDPQAPVLRSIHVEWARAFVLASDDHLMAFARERMHQGPATANAAKLRALIRKILDGKLKPMRAVEAEAIENRCVARSQLLRVSKMDKGDFDRALMQMQDLEELDGFDAKGKPHKCISNLALDE